METVPTKAGKEETLSESRPALPIDAVPSRMSASRRRRLKDQLTIRAWQVFLFAALIALWHAAAKLELGGPVVARSPRQVWDYLVEAVPSGELFHGTIATMGAVFISVALAAPVGITIGLVLGLMDRTDRVVGPFLDALNSMPRIAFAPLFVIIFGITIWAKVALAFSLIVFMFISSARGGVRSATDEMMTLSTTMGASQRQVFFKILLPVAVPSIFSALRLTMVYGLLAVITSEILASRSGLGQLLSSYANAFAIEKVYGILIVLAIISAIVSQAMAALERRLLRWRAPTDR